MGSNAVGDSIWGPMRLSTGDAEWKESGLVVVAVPNPISPLKAALGLSVIHSMPGAQCIFFP